jgi:site-specific DNA-methyltransferase (adenine-specific)
MDTEFTKRAEQHLICSDFLATTEIAPGSVNLIITSPPYNLGKHAGDDLSYDDYLEFSEAWLEKAYDLATPDGRLCLNVPLDKNLGGHRPVYADLVSIAKRVGWNYFTTIVWNEGNISRRTAWGSFRSARAPHLISPVEMIAVFHKGTLWRRNENGKSTIDSDDFVDWVLALWSFPGESGKRIGHPSPFPVELPRRLIHLLSYDTDTILDPFVGSGSTLLACQETGRIGIGVDIDPKFIETTRRRLKNESNKN